MRRPLVEFDLPQEVMEKMFGPSNELTVKSWEKRWLDNMVENLRIVPNPKPAQELIGKVNRHVCIVCGAGPSLRKLRKQASLIPPNWGVVVTDHALLSVLQSGLKPTLVVTMDGHQETEPVILEGFQALQQLHPECPVLIDLVSCPSVMELVPEKVAYFFRSHGDPSHIIGRYANREVPGMTQLGHGGNVGSVGLIMSKYWCFARHTCLIGFDSAMKEGTARGGYWYDREMSNDHQYIQTTDIYGRPITTMANLHNYKWWAEHFCFINDDMEWINCNDGGFLGVQSQQSNYNHFKYMTLQQAVDYLKDHGEDD